MTIGIGAICHEAKCIIMAADMRGSVDDPTFPPHEHIGKRFDLPLGFVVLTAGAKSVCQSFANRLYHEMTPLEGVPILYHDHVMKAIEEAQFKELYALVNQEMKTKLLTGIAEWKEMDAATLHYRRCQRLISKYFLNLHVSVGGFASDGSAVLLTAYSKYGPAMENPSFIGSGMDAAQAVLHERGQHPHMSSVRTMLHIHEALVLRASATALSANLPTTYC